VSKHKTKFELLRQIDTVNEQLRKSQELQENYKAYSDQLKRELEQAHHRTDGENALQGVIIALSVALSHVTKLEHGEKSFDHALEMTIVAARGIIIAQRKMYHPLPTESEDKEE